jgi:hypothetical protein
VQFPSSTTRSRLIVGFVAGAVGGAVAIALMELLAERTTFPLLFVPDHGRRPPPSGSQSSPCI